MKTTFMDDARLAHHREGCRSSPVVKRATFRLKGRHFDLRRKRDSQSLFFLQRVSHSSQDVSVRSLLGSRVAQELHSQSLGSGSQNIHKDLDRGDSSANEI